MINDLPSGSVSKVVSGVMASVSVNVLQLQRSIRCLPITLVWDVVGGNRIFNDSNPRLDSHELVALFDGLLFE